MTLHIAADKKIATGEVFRLLRLSPEMRKLVEDCYCDEDILGAAKRFYESEEFAAVLSYISFRTKHPKGSVLDLGGGNGVASLAYHWAGFEVVLAEPADDEVVGIGAIAPHVKGGQFNVRICKAVGERLPFAKETFDVVYSRSVLHHVPDVDTVCMEAYRVLKPAGLFIATREHVISRPHDLDVFLRKHPVHRYTGSENALLLSRYCGAIRRAGFAKVEVLGPWESIVNYYPMSRAEFTERCIVSLGRLFGDGLGRCLAHKPAISSLYGWYLTRRDRTPGRLYSFIAVR